MAQPEGYQHPVQEEQVLPTGITLPDVNKPYRGEITAWTHQFGMIFGTHVGLDTDIRTSGVVKFIDHDGRKWVQTRNSLYLLGKSLQEMIDESAPAVSFTC